MKKFAVALLAAACLVTACQDDIDQGFVKDRRFQPAHTDLVPMMCGKTMCLIPVHVADRWQLLLERNDENGWVAVPEEDYNTVEVGAYYTHEGPLKGPLPPEVCRFEDDEVKCHTETV